MIIFDKYIEIIFIIILWLKKNYYINVLYNDDN